jgi:two-component system response regulator HydG/two-component system response regulator AtoC
MAGRFGLLIDPEQRLEIAQLGRLSVPPGMSGVRWRRWRNGASVPATSSVVVLVECAAALQILQSLRTQLPDGRLWIAVRAASAEWEFTAVDVGGALRRDSAASTAGTPVSCPQMIGTSPGMERVRSYIARLASSDVNVLLTGESGTGKELAAELIHRSSKRRGGPLVAVNCAALPDTLLESELFGHSKGAFTGASEASTGRFCQASGGTLFLDEIGDMSLFAQSKVLRALETRRVDRLGGRAAIAVDIRVIAATSRNLESMVATGTFREDLYYRLNVLEIEMPALRTRAGDIPDLVKHYIQQVNTAMNTHVGCASEELMAALCKYAWPGNVRELRNLVEAAIAVNPSARTLSLEDLPHNYRVRLGSPPLDERERLLRVLTRTRGNKAAAAREMSWSRVTLYRRLKHYQITPAPRKDAGSDGELSRARTAGG